MKNNKFTDYMNYDAQKAESKIKWPYRLEFNCQYYIKKLHSFLKIIFSSNLLAHSWQMVGSLTDNHWHFVVGL